MTGHKERRMTCSEGPFLELNQWHFKCGMCFNQNLRKVQCYILLLTSKVIKEADEMLSATFSAILWSYFYKNGFGKWKLRVACTVKSISLVELVSQKVNFQPPPCVYDCVHGLLVCVCTCTLPLSCSSAVPGIGQPPCVSSHTGSRKWVQICYDLWVIHQSSSSNSISPSCSIILCFKMEGWHPAGVLLSASIGLCLYSSYKHLNPFLKPPLYFLSLSSYTLYLY